MNPHTVPENSRTVHFKDNSSEVGARSQALGPLMVLTLTALKLGLLAPSPLMSSGSWSTEEPDLLMGMSLGPSCQATAWCTSPQRRSFHYISTAGPWSYLQPLSPGQVGAWSSQLHSPVSRQEPHSDTVGELLCQARGQLPPVITSEMRWGSPTWDCHSLSLSGNQLVSTQAPSSTIQPI